MVTIANLSVNGMKTHGFKIRGWLEKKHPDIVTLQKIGSEKDFPTFREIGYESKCLYRRSHSDLGVAILICCNLPKPEVRFCKLSCTQQPELRFLTVSIGDLWVSSVYAPYDELGLNRKKLAIQRRVAWLNRLRDHLYNEGYDRRDSVLCGDFNVKFAADGSRGSGFYNQAVEDVLQEFLRSEFVDLYRRVRPCPKEDPGYTYGFHRNRNGTSRLHLALASKSSAHRLSDAWVDVESRPRKEAAPLIVDLHTVRV